MHDTAERVRRVRLRVGELHRKRENRFLGGLFSLCVILFFSLSGTVGVMTGGDPGGTVPALYGAMLLYEDAGGHVLVGVLSFAAAVSITALCLGNRKKTKRDGNNADETEEK